MIRRLLTRSATIVALAATLSVAAGGVVYAQSRGWYEPYDRGRKAFEAGKYAEAVPLLEQAVAADPKAGPNKIIEGVFRTDYFPYYYLALSYVELRQWNKAAQNLDKARPTLTRQQTPKFRDAESKIKLALAAPPPPSRNAAFDAGLRQAEANVAARNYDDAIKQFDQLRAMDPGEFARAGLAARRDEIVRTYAVQLIEEARALFQSNRITAAKSRLQIVDVMIPGQKIVADGLAEVRKREDDYRSLKAAAQSDFDRKNFAAARDKYQQAQATHQDLFAADGLNARLIEATTLAGPARGATRGDAPAPGTPNPPGPPPNARPNAAPGGPVNAPNTPSVDPRVAEGQRLARSAADLVKQGKYPEADALYASAAKADPKNREASDAVAKAAKFRSLRDRGVQAGQAKDMATAQKALADARTVDPDRFTREGLPALLDRLAKSASDDQVRAALRAGLIELLNGRADASIAIFEPALTRAGDSAPLHAYLGVAYATRALSAPDARDQSRLKDKALEQFRLAAAAEPAYQLSNRVVSPAIISLYESARR
jgi:hypothetical protein